MRADRIASSAMLLAVFLCIGFSAFARAQPGAMPSGTRPALRPVVEVEEDVYPFQPAQNGSSPMWCYGSTCLVRIGADVFASGLETISDAKSLNNVRWTLWRRSRAGWELQQKDTVHRTREPCPLVGFPDGRLFMSVNPTLVEDPNAKVGPARPEILLFRAFDPKAPFKRLLPDWKGKPAFTEHSYRTFAGDGRRGELILFNNVGYTHSQWAFMDRSGRWAATGTLLWPKRADPRFAPYKSKRARVNYPNVVLRNRAVHLCGASAFNLWERVAGRPDLMGRKWSNRWRRLYYTWCPDITGAPFRPWVEIASTHKTGGWLFPADMWLAPDGQVRLLWMEFPIGRQLRDQHFSDIKRITSLKYAVVRDGEVVLRRTLVQGGEGLTGPVPRCARFAVTPGGRLIVFDYVEGRSASGKTLRQNRVTEILPNGDLATPIVVPMTHPLGAFLGFFTATPRGGSSPSRTLDLLGYRAYTPDTPITRTKYKLHDIKSPTKISYARIRLW